MIVRTFLLITAVLLTPFVAKAQMRVPADSQQDAYVVRDVDGAASCREATAAEALVINAPNKLTHVFGNRSRVKTMDEGGLQIVLRGTTQLDANPQAKAAFERAAEIWESKISTPVTIIVDVDFGTTRFGVPFEDNVIASAGTPSYLYEPGDYPLVRAVLLGRANSAAEQTILNLLPLASVPTDDVAGDLTQVGAGGPLLRALGEFDPVPATGDPAPSIGFNSAFAYDFDPSDGIAAQTKDFEGVVVHEIGHMLGFASRVGAKELGGTPAPSMLDLFRFRPGVTNGSFGTAQRILSTGGDQVFYAGAESLGFSTGNGKGEGGDERQASHWKDDSLTGTRIGIMDPTLANAKRSELTDNDLVALGIIGWRLSTDVAAPEPTAPAAPAGLSAATLSTSSIRLNWTDNSSDETEFRVEQKTGTGAFSDIGPAAANATTLDVTGLAAGTQFAFRVRARNAVGDSAYSNEATATTNNPPGPCVPTATTVCLLSNRFQVVIDYVNPFSNPPNQPGTFLTARLLPGVQNPDTALFGFSSAQAVEVVVRIQDARPFAPRFDVYYGGMTDVGYTVTVSDTQTGVTRQYRNTAGTVGGGVDRASFPAN